MSRQLDSAFRLIPPTPTQILFPIPNIARLSGLQFCMQFICFDIATGACFEVSQGLAIQIQRAAARGGCRARDRGASCGPRRRGSAGDVRR